MNALKLTSKLIATLALGLALAATAGGCVVGTGAESEDKGTTTEAATDEANGAQQAPTPASSSSPSTNGVTPSSPGSPNDPSPLPWKPPSGAGAAPHRDGTLQ